MDDVRIAVIGATGAVGQVFLKLRLFLLMVGLDKKRGKQNGARLTGINVRVLETERSRARVAYRSNAELWRFYALVFIVKF